MRGAWKLKYLSVELRTKKFDPESKVAPCQSIEPMVEGELSNDCVKPFLLQDNGVEMVQLGTFYPHEPSVLLLIHTHFSEGIT